MVKWTEECETAFLALMEKLYSVPVLKSPSFKLPFMLQTDASNWGVEAVLR